MARVKKISHYLGDGISHTQLIEVRTSILRYLEAPLNIYMILWLANVLVFTVAFVKKVCYRKTIIIWPESNTKRLIKIHLSDLNLTSFIEWVYFLRNYKSKKCSPYIPKGILLVGPPGTGKTTLAQALAYEAKKPLICETVSYLYAGGGNIWCKVQELFRLAQKWSPSILFFDDMGTLGNRPSDPMTVTQKGVLKPHIYKTKFEKQKKKIYSLEDMSKSESFHKEMNLLTHFLIELDGMKKRKDVLVIGATHSIDGMDPALLRPGRFEKIVWLRSLSPYYRVNYLRHSFKRTGHTLTQENWNALGPLTHGLTGACLESLSQVLILRNKGKHKVTNEQVLEALDRLKKQKSIQKRRPRLVNTLDPNKGLYMKKWWINQITSHMANLPKNSWLPYYAHEPLGNWYQQAFVDSKNLPVFFEATDNENWDESKWGLDAEAEYENGI